MEQFLGPLMMVVVIGGPLLLAGIFLYGRMQNRKKHKG